MLFEVSISKGVSIKWKDVGPILAEYNILEELLEKLCIKFLYFLMNMAENTHAIMISPSIQDEDDKFEECMYDTQVR